MIAHVSDESDFKSALGYCATLARHVFRYATGRFPAHSFN